MVNMRLTHGLAYVNELFWNDLDLIIINLIQHVFKAWLPFFGKLQFNVMTNDGPASRTRSKVRITSHPLTPPPRVSQDGLPEIPRGRDNAAQKPIGKAKTLIQLLVYPPSQDDLEEHQNFLSTIYQVIEAKLAEEEGIFVASDAEIRDQKWSPLAPKADIPSADVISQDWAEDHTHSEFLREQARLNSYAAGAWRVLWTANPPDKKLLPEYYKTWSQLDDYCQKATQTWYNIQFKELKEDTAEALDLDPVNFRNIKTSTEWLADELEAAGKSPAYAAQQAVLRAESVASSKTPSRIQSLVIEAKIPASIKGMATPKARSKSADAIIRSHPSTPERDTTPTPQQSSDITSLEYIDEPVIKQESLSPQEVKYSTVLVNAAPIKHRMDMVVDETSKLSIYRGKFSEPIIMDTSEDFIPLKTDLVSEPMISNRKDKDMDTTADFASSKESNVKYHTAPSTLNPTIQNLTKGVTPLSDREDKLRRSHTPIRVLSNEMIDINFTRNLKGKAMTRAALIWKLC
ncbi:hypothetical protein AX15_006753 [Amanita polypyramis BW_CC]|nr:hypothetical protein AX15_006753 [Amanita polypyramis BW_CC]